MTIPTRRGRRSNPTNSRRTCGGLPAAFHAAISVSARRLAGVPSHVPAVAASRPESESPSTHRCRATGGRPCLTPRTRGVRARRVAARTVGSCRPRASVPCSLANRTDGQPPRRPEQPKPRFPTITGRPQHGQSPIRHSSIDVAPPQRITSRVHPMISVMVR